MSEKYSKYGLPIFETSNQLDENYRSFLKKSDEAWSKYRAGELSYTDAVKISGEASTYAESLRTKLPFKTSVGYAYSPRESSNSKGSYHIKCEEPVMVGDFKRDPGQTLCGKKFWGLESRRGHEPSCLKCIDTAEKILAKEVLEGKFKEMMIDPVEDLLVPTRIVSKYDIDQINKEMEDDRKN